jgi:hypothetical protein
MSLLKCFDASDQLPASAPRGCEACLGYIGGTALHTWTLQQWQQFGHLIQFPCWGADFAGNPVQQAAAAAKTASKLGWSHGRAIILDMEAVEDEQFFTAWAGQVRKARFTPVWYGSRDSSGQAAGYIRWLADPDGIAALQPGFDAVQYAWNVAEAGGLVDLSVVDSRLAALGGRGPRK